jgi:HrpA-like RNA helicase
MYLCKQHPSSTGETGCGKTTQIPQFLNEVNPNARIVVCQPRRLAAIGVATRVADELAGRIGDKVGYMVKGDSKASERTRIVFCTYGVLLRRLQDEPDIDGIDYVILDEVHGKNINIILAFCNLNAYLRPGLYVLRI